MIFEMIDHSYDEVIKNNPKIIMGISDSTAI